MSQHIRTACQHLRSKKALRLDFFANPPFRVPSLEYPPDIHLSGTVGYFQLATSFLNNFNESQKFAC